MDVMSVAVAIKETGARAVESALESLAGAANDATKDLKGMDGMLGGLGTTLAGLAASIGAAAIFEKIAAETSQAEFATAQLNAALKSTQGVAGQSVEALNAHAAALQQVSVFDDDVIAGGQAMLLTFTKIQGDIFPKATEAVLNVAQAMGTDLKSAAIQVGKALNDPILGVSALARSGIQFSEAQREMIKQMVEANRLADAQRIILKELEVQFGGSAKAARDTFGGALQALQNDIGNALTLTGQSASMATQLVNYFALVVRETRKGLDNLINFLDLAVTAIGGTLRILKAMEMSPTEYAARYAEITAEMRRSLDTFRAGYNTVKDAGQASKEAGAYFGGLSSSTATASSAFGVFSDKVLRATTAVRDFFAGATGTKRGGGAGTTAKPAAPQLNALVESAFAEIRKAQQVVAMEIADPAEPFMSAAIAGLDARRDEMIDAYRRNIVEPAQQMGEQLRQVLSAGIANAFQALTARGGNIGDAFKALGQTILSGLGDMLIQLGTSLLPVAALLAKVRAALLSLNPVAMTAAAIGLIAIGGMMKGAASRMVPSGQGAPVSSGGFGYSAAGGGGITLPGVTYLPTAAGGMGSQVTAATPMQITIIGPNDPTAQRQMQELIANANRRGQTRAV